jgi:hypothetical protein
MRTGSRVIASRVRGSFAARGPGFRRLAETHAAGVAGDTLVAVGLAGTLFFDVPSADARGNMTLYLLITLAPFAVLAPILGGVMERFPGAYRGGLITSSLTRAFVAFVMAFGLNTLWLYPLAFLMLVLSRLHGISRSSVLPSVLESPEELVSANAHLARLGVVAGAVVAPLGAALAFIASWLALMASAVVFALSAAAAGGLPASLRVPRPARRGTAQERRALRRLPRSVRLARFATAGARFLNGYLLLLVTFAFRDVDAGFFDFGALLGAAGLGYFLASVATPALEKRLTEEPLVVAALALEAGAAFLAAEIFGLPAAAALAGFAGFAWGAAKFGFDGLLQATVRVELRGRAFTSSESLFQLAWVVGAVIPVAITIPTAAGLVASGLIALVVQVFYVSALLVPLARERRRQAQEEAAERAAAAERRITDLF